MPTSAKLKIEYDGASGIEPAPRVAIWGDTQNYWGVAGTSKRGSGVLGISESPTYSAVSGLSSRSPGVYGYSGDDYGVHGVTGDGAAAGVYGEANWDERKLRLGTADGVLGVSGTGNGIAGSSAAGEGVLGESTSGFGVLAASAESHAVVGFKDNSKGVAGWFSNITLGPSRGWPLTLNQAARFIGHVEIVGNLHVSGTKSFRIDHPMDPSNQYLSHAAVESDEMKNVYDGIVTLNPRGEAVVTVPRWLDALNKAIRYQLTAIGAPAPDLHIAEELKARRFRIGGGSPGLKVSWQLTGVRRDAWAAAHPMRVEEPKSKDERGRFLHPELQQGARSKAWGLVASPRLLEVVKRATRGAERRSKRRVAVAKRRKTERRLVRPLVSHRP